MPGQIAYVYPGVYTERIKTGHDGTSNAPIWLIAEHGPVQRVILQDPQSVSTEPFIRITKKYWIIGGFDINAQNPTKDSGEAIRFDHTCCVLVRNIQTYNGLAKRAVDFNQSTDVAILNSKVHNYASPGEDSHAIVVTNGSERVLIKDNECFDNNGDATQCLDPVDFDEKATSNPPKHITIEGNKFHHNDENAVDLKSCQDVTVRGNIFYGYRPAKASGGSSPFGDAIVVHYKADRVIIQGNDIWDSGRAISVGTKAGYVIFRRNTVHDMTVVQDGTGRDVAGSGSGIEVSEAKQAEIYHNTFYNLPRSVTAPTSGYAIRIGGQGGITDLASILNNIVMNAGINMYINLPDISKLVSDHNLFFPAQTFIISSNGASLAGWQAQGYDCASIEADPLFLSAGAGDFHTQPGSPARDKAIPIQLRLELSSYYGSGPDIGAVESP